MQEKPDLSVIILNHNTKLLLTDCLNSLKKVSGEVDLETIVVDNGSTDGSPEKVKKEFPLVKLIESGENLGFAKGNNLSRNVCRGEYILFLNSDSLLKKGVLKKTVEYMRRNSDVGALTCKLVLPSGKLDKDARRSFPTPWISFSHLVLPLDKIFPKSRFFAGYWYGYISEDQVHEVDVIQGAFFLTRKMILDKVGWFDEDYFLDGEDIDLCWKIKDTGMKIVYYPEVSIIHLKGASKGKTAEFKKNVRLGQRIKFRLAGVDSMELFYKKHFWKRYPLLVNVIVVLGINLVKILRIVLTVLS
jgi:GT2 family glycosyltransferase